MIYRTIPAIMTIKPKSDTMSKAKPINLKPNFKKKGPNAQNNNIKPTIIAIIPPIPLIILPPYYN